MASASSTELELSATEDDLAQAMRLLALEKRKRDAAFDAYGKTPGSDLLKAKYHVAQAEVAVARCRADVLDEGQSLAVAKARLRGIHPKRGEEYEEARKEYDEAEKMLEKAEARLKAASDELDKTKKELKETDGAGSALALAQDTAYVVEATVGNAANVMGIRGNVYRQLQESRGFYLEAEGAHIQYIGDGMENLEIKAYFKIEDNALIFFGAVMNWQLTMDVLRLSFVNVAVPKKVHLKQGDNLLPFTVTMYDASASGSPCMGLRQVITAPSSTSVSECEASSDLVKFQSIEDHTRRGGVKFYQMHLRDKAKCKDGFKHLQKDENNLLAGTWLFHQLLDALNLDEGVPLLRLHYMDKSEERDATKDGRVRVTLQIEFFNVAAEEMIKANFKQGTARVRDLVWEAAVWVQDAAVFEQCVQWKGEDTRRKWQDYQESLEAE